MIKMTKDRFEYEKPTTNARVNNCVGEKKRILTITQYIFKRMANRIASNKTKMRGMLGWLSTGAGKTTIAAGILEEYSTKDKMVYYISRHDALKPKSEFKKILEEMYKKREKEAEKITEKLKIMSIVAFYNRVEKKEVDLEKAVIIIDEAQYLFAKRAVPRFREKHEKLIKKLEGDNGANIYILSATPGDNKEELIRLLNMIRRKEEGKIIEENMKEHLKGKIVYVNMNNDVTRFPTVKYQEHYVPMSERQMGKYNEKTKKLNMSDERSVKTAQKWSNGLYITKGAEPKVKSVVNHIMRNKGEVHYVYSQFYRQGLADVERELQERGYKRAMVGNIDTKDKKYMVAKASEKFKTTDTENKILAKYNSKENATGKYIGVLLATDSYNAGIDLKSVKHVHFLEPPIKYIDVIQGVGRAARYCSHKFLRRKDWKVTVHSYFSTGVRASVKGIDEMVYNNSKREEKRINAYMQMLKDASVDCKVMYHFHGEEGRCVDGNPTMNMFARRGFVV